MPPKKELPKPKRLEWDRQSPEYWSSVAGYIKLQPDKTWTAFLHRNTRTGKGWTESKAGFLAPDKARRWIEREAED